MIQKLHTSKNLVLLLMMIGPAVLAADDQLVTSYATVISRNDIRNSKGEALGNVEGVIMQDRANVHKFGNPDGDMADDYFKTAERRAEIPAMLKLGTFPEQLATPVLKGEGYVIRVSVYRNAAGRLYMSVGSRIRDQAGYDPSLIDPPKGDSDAGIVRVLKLDSDERKLILDVLRIKVSVLIGEPVDFKGDVRVVDSWAKMNGNVFVRSGKEPKDEEAKSLLELDYAALLRKENGEWKVLHHGFAGDVGLEIEMRQKFPEVPQDLVPRISE